jgi:hypothetical protein
MFKRSTRGTPDSLASWLLSLHRMRSEAKILASNDFWLFRLRQNGVCIGARNVAGGCLQA